MLFHTAKSCSTRRLSVARLIISTEPGIGFRCENEDKNVKILVIENALGIGKNTRRVFNGSVGENYQSKIKKIVNYLYSVSMTNFICVFFHY